MTNERLTRLFQEYWRRYWPRSRRLGSYRVEQATLDKAWGECDYQRRTLSIDVRACQSEKGIRSTLLHEMAHAVVGRGGHRAAFWTQLESLLVQGAPLTVGFPELGEAGRHPCVIPPRFRRCRRLFKSVYSADRRRMARAFSHAGVQKFTTSDLERESLDAALEGHTWRTIWAVHADTWGFVDLDGQLLPWARKWRRAARRGYERGRRFWREEQQLAAAFTCNRKKGGQ